MIVKPRSVEVPLYVAGIAKGCVGNPDICLHVQLKTK